MSKRSSRILSLVIATFIVLAGIVTAFPIAKVSAAGLATTVTPSALSAATATEVTFSYTPSAGYAAADTVAITAASGVTITNTCATPTTDSAAPTGADGSGSVSGQTYTYTYTSTTTSAVAHSFCIKMTAATGNYGITFTDSKGNYGGTLIYVGSANVVNVSATVNPVIAFQIVTTGNINTGTNTCALGTLSLASVNTCDYRLKITTNSSSGYTVTVTTDGDLRKSGSGDVADNLDIDRIASGTVTAGTEGYGVAVTPGSVSGGGTITAQGAFATADTQLPFTGTSMLVSTSSNNPSINTYTPTITHRAAMDGDTSAGFYTQAVTYTVTASF